MNDPKDIKYALKWIYCICKDTNQFVIDTGPHLGKEGRIRTKRIKLLEKCRFIELERITDEYLIHGTLTESGIKLREKTNVK